MSSIACFVSVLFAFVVGTVTGVFSLALFSDSKNKEYNICLDYRGYKYAIIDEDAIDDMNCKHVVVLRAMYGRHITFVVDKKEFTEGKVITRNGKEIKKYTKF